MQIPISWINELVKIETIQLDSLIEKLTLGGFEVEKVIALEINGQEQIALDISATANRSDSLSIQGLSIEIAALLNKSVTNSKYSAKAEQWKQFIETKAQPIPENSNCSLFLALTVENIPDLSIPKWVSQKLLSSGIVPSNSLVDFQNYVLLETGYPFCFYDFQKICSRSKTSNFELSISSAKSSQQFLASNNLNYELDPSILTINANETPISIAGLIEADDFTCSENTSVFLVEGSIFNAAKIRQQSRKLGLRTDRSARYEKSLKNVYLIDSLYRLISLLRISNPNLVCKLHTVNKVVEELSKPILLRYETINEILGPISQLDATGLNNICPSLIAKYLSRLNFEFTFLEINQTWLVEVPLSRAEDITREIDLIEEIGRLHGFNNFLTTIPKIKTVGQEDLNYKARKKITACLLNSGFNELIHYSLVNETTFVRNEVQLVNPLLSDCSNLRSSLMPSLIKTLQENLKQKNTYIEGFEYGHVFFNDPVKKFTEKECVAGIFGGVKMKSSWSSAATELNWFEAKGKIEELFNQLNVSVNWRQSSLSSTKNILHPYRSAELYLEGDLNLGSFGQIHPTLSNQLNFSSEIYLFEFDMEMIKEELEKNRLASYREYSMYPKIIKDLSFIIRTDVPFKQIQEALYSNGTEFLSEINLLDEYQGKTIPEQQTSLCLQLIFQSSQRTLENKEVENILNQLQSVLINKFDVVIRA